MCTEIVLKKNINGWVKFNYKLNNTNYYNSEKKASALLAYKNLLNQEKNA